MAKKATKKDTPEFFPMLMPASTMSRVSGIGEATLRTLMAKGEIEYLEIGTHKLLCVNAIWDYYERRKIRVRPAALERLTPVLEQRRA